MNPSNSSNQSILLTIDVEDWFQVENFKQYIPFSSWPNCELRVEKNTHHILNLLDSHNAQRIAHSAQRIKDPPASQARALRAGNGQLTTDNRPENNTSLRQRRIGSDHFHPRPPRLSESDGGQVESDPDKNKSQKSSKSCLTTPKATFFVLGWIAERLPHLVKEIHSRGHEVASHGYQHNLCTDCSSEDLKTDLVESKKSLEDITGSPVHGYRAPSFSINDDVLKIIEECGYLYDSSFNSFGMHRRYGQIQLSQNTQNGIAAKISDAFYELPVSNLRLGNRILPWAGGGYFRLIPFPLFKIGIKFVLGQESAYLFYFHPWEIDPEQPKVNDAPFFYKFRHYINLNKTYSKLSKLIGSFRHHWEKRDISA